MKTIFKRFLAILCVVTFVIASSSTAYAHSGRTDSSGGHKDNKNKSGLGSYHYHCGGYPAHLHDGGYCPYTDVFPSSVTIKTAKTTLGIGETVSIDAYVSPSNACNTNVTMYSSDPSIVALRNGELQAVNYGTAIITAESFNGKKTTVKITVKEITADKVSISGMPDASVFYIGESLALSAIITPENVDNPSIVWSSSNEDIATVINGKVQLKSEGKVEIKATASNGVAGKVFLNVKEKYVESVEITDAEKDIFLGEVHTLTAAITPEDASFPQLTWAVTDPDILSISADGEITAQACGETTVTVTSTNGISDTILVRVNEIKAESMEIEGSDSILIGDSMVLTTVFSPSDTSDQNVKWSVDKPSIAAISNKGEFTTKNVGTVTVTAKQKDVTATYTIEILPIKVESIQITASTEESVSKDDIITFSAVVSPSNATYPEITWSVSDPEIATIDADGVLTALKSGKVTVIATSADGFSAEYELDISSAAAGVVGTVGLVGIGAAVAAVLKKKKR